MFVQVSFVCEFYIQDQQEELQGRGEEKGFLTCLGLQSLDRLLEPHTFLCFCVLCKLHTRSQSGSSFASQLSAKYANEES
jgi:hypothetical protein